MLSNMQENLRKAQGYVDEMKEAIKEIKEAHTWVAPALCLACVGASRCISTLAVCVLLVCACEHVQA